MAFRKISYLIPSCDGCGLAWSFGDPACADGIRPHFAGRAAALGQLPADYIKAPKLPESTAGWAAR